MTLREIPHLDDRHTRAPDVVQLLHGVCPPQDLGQASQVEVHLLLLALQQSCASTHVGVSSQTSMFTLHDMGAAASCCITKRMPLASLTAAGQCSLYQGHATCQATSRERYPSETVVWIYNSSPSGQAAQTSLFKAGDRAALTSPGDAHLAPGRNHLDAFRTIADVHSAKHQCAHVKPGMTGCAVILRYSGAYCDCPQRAQQRPAPPGLCQSPRVRGRRRDCRMAAQWAALPLHRLLASARAPPCASRPPLRPALPAPQSAGSPAVSHTT